MPTYFITGASRGLGLEYVRQLLAASPNNTVIATARTPSAPLTELKGLGKLHVFPCEVSSKESVEACAEEVKKVTDRIDYLFNNAGTSVGHDNPSDMKVEGLKTMFDTNVVGQVLVVQALESLFVKGTVIVNVTSGLGSLGDALARGAVINTGYSITKAAVNMLSIQQALHYRDCIVISLDPGWVKTDMGGPNAPLEKTESISTVLKTVHGLKKEDSGYSFLYNGNKIPF